MGAFMALRLRELRVDPGNVVECPAVIRNTGEVVDQFTMDVVGASHDWTEVTPPIVNLMPGAEAEVVVRFAPPRSPYVAAGTVPLGVRALSREDPQGSVVVEGTIEVAPFAELEMELLPRTSQCRRRARHQVAVDNKGNQPVIVDLHADDEADQ